MATSLLSRTGPRLRCFQLKAARGLQASTGGWRTPCSPVPPHPRDPTARTPCQKSSILLLQSQPSCGRISQQGKQGTKRSSVIQRGLQGKNKKADRETFRCTAPRWLGVHREECIPIFLGLLSPGGPARCLHHCSPSAPHKALHPLQPQPPPRVPLHP